MARVTAYWLGEELGVAFSADKVLTDYGVPRSEHYAIENERVDAVELLGSDVDFAAMSKELQGKIMDLCDELDWEDAE
jgi:hypothetical protein